MEPETPHTSIDSSEIEKAANRLKAIAHPTRVLIIDLLSEHKKLCVTDIYKALNLEQAVASNHLNILKEKGVLSSKRNGQKIVYSLKSKTLSTLMTCVKKLYTAD